MVVAGLGFGGRGYPQVAAIRAIAGRPRNLELKRQELRTRRTDVISKTDSQDRKNAKREVGPDVVWFAVMGGVRKRSSVTGDRISDRVATPRSSGQRDVRNGRRAGDEATRSDSRRGELLTTMEPLADHDLSPSRLRAFAVETPVRPHLFSPRVASSERRVLHPDRRRGSRETARALRRCRGPSRAARAGALPGRRIRGAE
jgi:hypothetical protein